MPTAKLIIKKTAIRKNGIAPIYIQYSYNRSRRTLINTKKKIDHKYWNADKSEVRKSHPEATELNAYLRILLNRVLGLIDESILHKVDPTIEHIRMKCRAGILFCENENKPDFFNHFDQFVVDARARVVPNVLTDYLSLKRHLLLFKEEVNYSITFESIDYNFYLKFTDFLYQVKKSNGKGQLATNTVGKQIKNLKRFYRYCIKLGITAYKDLSDFKEDHEEVDSVYLNEDEIQRIADLKLVEGSLMDRCRDLFIIGCETGLRFSDFSKLKPANIGKDFIRKKMQKTNDLVVIPISKRLRPILEKYNNTPPTDISNNVVNYQAKILGSHAGITEEVVFIRKRRNEKIEERHLKFQLIGSHTCRRSFCTNQFNKRVPDRIIRKISGHKTEASFLKYIKVDQEAAAKRMLEYWEQ